MRNGSSTIIKMARIICRMVGLYGLAGITRRTTPQFALAVEALNIACRAWEALDDQPGETDGTVRAGVSEAVDGNG